jgi:2-polyprenyl-3-methyl-5-hydroxy-6-metoxy-1,4-benzoquinol methylase
MKVNAAAKPEPAVLPPRRNPVDSDELNGSIYTQHRKLLRRIIAAYNSRIVRAYCVVRFIIININMLHILSLCMRGKRRVLEIGCGFGLFACYFAARNSNIRYHGIDLNAGRIEMARKAARTLQLENVRFECRDARDVLELEPQYDVIIMMDLMHHLPDESKHHLLQTVMPHLAPGGRVIFKEISRKPAWKLFFTWVLDVLMTGGFDMWYWNARQFREAMDPSFDLEIYPIADLLPYPHVVYLFTREELV